MTAASARRFVFHFSLNMYELPDARLNTACANAALGENVPAKPPDSFHATSWSAPPLTLTKMPRSWLKPEVAVHRSAFAPSTATSLDVGAMLSSSLLASTSDQVEPSLRVSEYCSPLTALTRLDAGTSWTVRRVGEYCPPIGPAPA